MTTPLGGEIYGDALVVLGTAGIVVPLLRRLGVSSVLGYLGAGAILGPYGLGSLRAEYGVLPWITISDSKSLGGIAELGVVFLLFTIGLELSYNRLLTMRRLVFGLGLLQVVASTAVIAAICAAAGLDLRLSIILGACLALSSTAIVVDVLACQRRLATATGRASFSILLAQDLAVVPLLLFLLILGSSAEASVYEALALALLKAALGLSFILIVARLFLRPLFRLVASAGSSEPFMAATLFVVVATGVTASRAGLSMALGAFLAGLLLAETEYRKSVEIAIEPFKGVLLGLFFFTVGMGIDFREILNHPGLVFGAIVALVIVKAAIVLGIAPLFGVPRPAALETALLLGPAGEFAFVGLGLAAGLKLIPAEISGPALAVVSLSMAFIPLLDIAGRKLAERAAAKRPGLDAALFALPETELKDHAIVVGHGRVGQVLCSLLERHRFPFIASDKDPDVVSHHRRLGREVYYGDAANPAFLNACGLQRASALIITITAGDQIVGIVKTALNLRPDLVILSRARDATHAHQLYAIGVTDAVPETIEASLQLSEASLVALGIPAGPAIASIHEMRDEFRAEFQDAARRSGRQVTRAIRRKTLRDRAPKSAEP
ncbi:potassium transporter TrkA [Rhodomicrobium udaipurense JA643]|uniref:Cation:proton antiporter n=1 Tax=Rhodomicrobium udaipurense TaxID=1202716 RepID=A0A8I1GB26_9HYPH|nr:cation:proton antiporter [Rhodomicrobium udaipurense]KAI95956.1 potassium transporter TrkA [Rhodomicrobium udaipurense JA643]MBJ7543797.1 cation:proton antiporter [Rhodomicrobium udaipurense]